MPDRPLPTSHKDLLALYPGTWARAGWGILGVVAVILIPLALSMGYLSGRWTSVALEAAVLIVGAVGLMLLTGITGQISLGHAAFLAVGGFTASAVCLQWGLPWWLVLPLSGAVAAAIGMAVGPFALRLKGLYLAIVTLGLVFIVQHVLLRWEAVSGGFRGKPVIMWNWFQGGVEGQAPTIRSPGAFGATEAQWGPITLDRDLQLYFLYLVLVVVAVIFAKNLLRTRMGRAMAAVGASDIAAAAVGVRVGRTKIGAFAVSSFYAGVAGAMFGWKQGFLTVDPPFGIEMSVEFIAIIFIGGIGTIFGAVAGAMLFAFGRLFAERLGDLSWLAATPLQPGHITLLLFSLAVIGFVVFEPGGLLGIWLAIKRYFLTWPVPRRGK